VRRVRRAGAVAVLVVGMLIAIAAPAQAHGRATDATNYASRITDAPELAAMRWAVYGGDELLAVTNTSDRELTVLGYDGEPYLRVGPEGVWRNRRSPAAYLNQDRYAEMSLPPEVDAEAAPDWERVSDDPSHAWHDHRIHYMAPSLPAAIAADPDSEQIVPGFERWEVPFRYDGEEHVVAGQLWWVPGPSPWPWLAAGAVLALVALAGLPTRPRLEATGPEGGCWPGLARPAALLLGVVATANITSIVDDLAAVPVPVTQTAFGAAMTAAFTAAGGFAAWRGWRATHAGFIALGVGAAMLGVGQGLLLLPVLGSSQLATVFPEPLVRLLVATSLAQAPVVAAVAGVGYRRLLPTLPDTDPDERPAETA
jgi:hypothetical protein